MRGIYILSHNCMDQATFWPAPDDHADPQAERPRPGGMVATESKILGDGPARMAGFAGAGEAGSRGAGHRQRVRAARHHPPQDTPAVGRPGRVRDHHDVPADVAPAGPHIVEQPARVLAAWE